MKIYEVTIFWNQGGLETTWCASSRDVERVVDEAQKATYSNNGDVCESATFDEHDLTLSKAGIVRFLNDNT